MTGRVYGSGSTSTPVWTGSIWPTYSKVSLLSYDQARVWQRQELRYRPCSCRTTVTLGWARSIQSVHEYSKAYFLCSCRARVWQHKHCDCEWQGLWYRSCSCRTTVARQCSGPCTGVVRSRAGCETILLPYAPECLFNEAQECLFTEAHMLVVWAVIKRKPTDCQLFEFLAVTRMKFRGKA